MIKDKLILILLLCFCLSGCATIRSLNNTREFKKERVVEEIFSHSKEKVFKAAKRAVIDSGLGIIREDEKEGAIYARSPAMMTRIVWTATGYGEHIGVYVVPLEANKTQVEIVIQKSCLLDVGYTDYRTIVMNSIRTQLKNQ